jgi:hypothetical protein
MLKRKLACTMLALVMAGQPMVAGAVDLGGAFNNLVGNGAAVSINDPGRFQSSARGGYSGGGIEMRIPRSANSPQLITASPARISAGCNGISAHFGGFSFISGAEFGRLLKQIGSGAALGFVSSLVMKSLCPMCQDVVADLKTAAQMAAKGALDSCKIGQDWGKQAILGLTNGRTDHIEGWCSSTAADSGETLDTGSASATLCKNLTDAHSSLKKWNLEQAGSPAKGSDEAAIQLKKFECEIAVGNQTWATLSAFDGAGSFGTVNHESNTRKLILINLLGAQMTYAGADKEVGCEGGNSNNFTASESGQSKFCPPPADVRLYTGLFMCGAGQPTNTLTSPAVIKYCNSYMQSADVKVWGCKASASKGAEDDFNTCPFLQLVSPSEVFKGPGFLTRINAVLRDAVRRVRDNQAFDSSGDSATSSGGITVKGSDIMGLIQAAPYPLYQAINAAAVYPAAMDQILDTMSVLVAEQYTHAMFNELIQLEGRSSTSFCLNQENKTQILNFVSALRSQNEGVLNLIAQNFSVQQGITEQIRSINQTIQKQVLSEDLLATGKVTQSINNALSPVNVGAQPSATNP